MLETARLVGMVLEGGVGGGGGTDAQLAVTRHPQF